MSPFGLGEFSGKDYEAALSGTLLVSPPHPPHVLRSPPPLPSPLLTLPLSFLASSHTAPAVGRCPPPSTLLHLPGPPVSVRCPLPRGANIFLQG